MAEERGIEVAPRALGDARFARLAQLCGMRNRREALGAMLEVWEACRTMRTRVLPDEVLVELLGPGAERHLVEARLGEKVLTGGVRVAGSGGIRFPAQRTEPGAPAEKAPRGRSWTPEETAIAARVIGKLAERSGTNYRADASYNVGYVVRLLRDGFTERDLQRVVWHRCLEWRDDPKMEQFLRPKTLFGPENFANYLPQADAEVERRQAEEQNRKRAAEAGAPFFNQGENR